MYTIVSKSGNIIDKDDLIIKINDCCPYSLDELVKELWDHDRMYECLIEIGVNDPQLLTIEQSKKIGEVYYQKIADMLTEMGHPDPYRERSWN